MGAMSTMVSMDVVCSMVAVDLVRAMGALDASSAIDGSGAMGTMDAAGAVSVVQRRTARCGRALGGILGVGAHQCHVFQGPTGK